MEESQPILKAKKRNYVAYPGDNVTAVDVGDGKDEGRTTRALRKNALKERNCGSPTEVAEPPSDNKPATDLTRSVRSTRRTRRFPENVEDAPESVPQNEEQIPKPKKDKKKKRKAEKEEIEEEAKQLKVELEVKAVPKKKSKKKKGRGSGSMVVEDIVPEAPSTLNKSNMSVDSFHSAAGSPRNTNNEADEVQNDEDIDKVIEVRKTMSSGKPVILSNHDQREKHQQHRKTSLETAMDISDDFDKGEESIIRISNSRNATPDTKDEEKNSTFNVEENKSTSTRKSKRSTFHKTITPRKVNRTFDEGTNETNKISDVTIIADDAIEPAEQNVDTESVKGKRKSVTNAMTQLNTNKPTPKKSNKKKSIANDLIKNNGMTQVLEDKKFEFDGTCSYISADNSSPIKQSGEILNKTVDKDLVIESVKGKKNSAINATSQISPNNKLTPRKSFKRKSIAMNTSENDIEAKKPQDKKSVFDATYITAENSSPITNKDIKKSIINTSFEKELEPSSELEIESKKNETYDITSSPFKSAYEVSSPIRINDLKRKSVINTTVGKGDSHHVTENCKSTDKKNTTFEKESTQETDHQNNKIMSSLRLSTNVDSRNNSTFEIDQDKKLDRTFDKHSKSSILTSDSSMITLDKSNNSCISITSDESKNEENIFNATPVLIESSLDESALNTTQTKVTTPVKMDTTVSAITPLKREGTFTKDETEATSSPNSTQTKVTTPVKNATTVSPVTPLKREGTFTKDTTEAISSPKPRVSRTPTKRMSLALPSPGFTPFHINKSSSKEKSAMLNVTRSIEKRRSSLLEPPRTTKVMFCSPDNNPAVVNQIKKKVIKSNLKGSNKSFVFDESGE